jgi:hypothetical protein
VRDPLAPVTQPGQPDAEHALFEVRKRIHPRAVTGWFAAWRWALVWATQLLFYGLPWLSWGDRPAVLFALEDRRFFIFGLVLYPQDFIYLTGLLIVSALSLFLFTAVAGRLWCGYACPQTVYTDRFMWIERASEGDRNARIKLDSSPWTLQKIARRGSRHLAWVVVALWTGITFVGYFTPIRTLTGNLAAHRDALARLGAQRPVDGGDDRRRRRRQRLVAALLREDRQRRMHRHPPERERAVGGRRRVPRTELAGTLQSRRHAGQRIEAEADRHVGAGEWVAA